jgi:MYXO-CTERM domain-containing protein
MKRLFAFSAALAMGMVSSAAFAAPGIRTYKILDNADIGGQWKAPTAAAVSHVIYLNNCKPNGCTMKPGNENSATNTGGIPDQTSLVSAYKGSDATWNQVVNCVKQTYADFDVQIVTTRPTSGSYHMAIVAGSPNEVQQGSNVMGVSPFSCGYINNSTSYTFANLAPNDVNELCWTIAQETAHSWGLDHKYDNRDPMTYLSGGPATKRFQDEAGSCGEYSARSCQCSYSGTGQAKMNSHAVIMQTFGSSAPDVTAPTVTVTYPTEMAQVTPGFPVKATTTDDRIVEKVELRLDGMLIGMKAEVTDFSMNTPGNLSQGKHKIEVTAYDHAGNKTASVVNVQYGTVCTSDAECDTAGSVCLGGHCEAGPSVTGGLGTDCTDNAACASGQCGNDGEHGYCVTTCDIGAAGSCPSNFSCVDAGNGGVCWPSPEDGGCNASGSSNVWLLALGLVGLVMTRRRRRATRV